MAGHGTAGGARVLPSEVLRSVQGRDLLPACKPAVVPARVVFALVVASETTYVGAEVAHVTAVRVSRSGSLERIENEASRTEQVCSLENGERRMFLVGCRITTRLGTKPTSRLWLT